MIKTISLIIFQGWPKIEKDGVYRAEKIYSFTIRTVDFQLAKFLTDNMKNSENRFVNIFL